jgi:hypothetical protein
VSRIWTREEAFSGPHAALAPDLTLALHDGGLISILASDAVVKARVQPTGTHRPEGVFIAAGRPIRSGARVEQLSILDVAPLLLHSLGIPVPDRMAGRVPAEALDGDWLKAHPVRGSTAEEPSTDALQAPVEMVYSEEEERELAERLRALGYIE